METPKHKSIVFTKPGRNYVRAFCKGNLDNLSDTYQRIIEFSKEHKLTLNDDSYEEGINELTINHLEEHITQIMILCDSSAP